MPLRSYPNRVLVFTALASIASLGLCATSIYFLKGEQARIAAVLSEDIGSRGAAYNLEAILGDLLFLHQNGSKDVEPLHDQVKKALEDVERFANKDEEIRLSRRATESFNGYFEAYNRGVPAAELARLLKTDTIAAALALRNYNGEQLRISEQSSRIMLDRMIWGLMLVGGFGSLGGLAFGYGLARSLRQTIHQFLIRVQSASSLLAGDEATVEWRQGDSPRDGADDLIQRVEDVVRKLERSEREMLRAERLAALGTLAAGVAHELRNPLTSVLLLIETARKDPATGGLTEEDLDMIEQELHRIERSLQAFLDFARPAKLERSECDLGSLLREAWALVRGRAHRQHVSATLSIPESPPILTVDREQLRQVVVNLILNALDALPQGGRIELVLTPLDARGDVEIRVVDTGPGIAAAILPKLFEPFVSAKETGLGMGLVVSQRIVRDHGGELRGFNRPQGGACFIARLPGNLTD